MHVRISILSLALLSGTFGCASVPPSGSLPHTVAAQASKALDATVAGRPALVSLWATWCEACTAEFGALNRLDARTRGGPGVIVGIAVGEPQAKVAAYVRDRGLHYAQVVDEDFVLADALGEHRVPATLVLDRAGRVIFRGGALDEEALRAFQIVTDPAQ